MRRRLRGLEKTMVQVGPTMGPDMVIGIVKGALPADVLRRAVEMLQRQYATLRTRVEGADLVVGGPVPLSFEVVDGDWRNWAASELQRPLRLEAAEAMRVVFVPADGAILLSVHHALVDGTSLLLLLRDLLAHCASLLDGQLEEPPCVPLAPAVLDSVPGPVWHTAVGGVVAAAAPVVLAVEQRVLLNQGAREGAMRSTAVFAEGSRAGLNRLTAACKVHGVTVGGAAMAAASFALGVHRATVGGVLSPVDIEVEVDLRKWAKPPLPADRVGFHTGGVRLDACDLDFWSLARTFKRRTQRQIEFGVPRMAHLVAQMQQWSPREAPGSWAAVSNLGRFPHRTSYGPLELDAVYGMNGTVPGGPAVILWLRCIGGRLCFNAVGSMPTITPSALEAISDNMMRLLENPAAVRLSNFGRPVRALAS